MERTYSQIGMDERRKIARWRPTMRRVYSPPLLKLYVAAIGKFLPPLRTIRTIVADFSTRRSRDLGFSLCEPDTGGFAVIV